MATFKHSNSDIMKIRIFLIVLCVFAGTRAFAQLEEINNMYQEFRELKVRNWELEKHNYKGSPYLSDKFADGLVVLKSKQTNDVTVHLRYNVYSDNLEFKKDDKVLVLLKDTTVVESFSMGNTKFVLIPIPAKDEVASFAEEVYSGMYGLYRRHIVSFTPEVKAKGYQDPAPPTYTTEDPVYYLKIGAEYMKVKNLKDISKKISSNSDKLLKFIKSNKLKMKNDNDLVKYMTYLNSIS